MPSRIERSPVAEWWWTIDRVLISGLIVLMIVGLIFLMGGSPPVAQRLNLPTFHFVNRQAIYLLPAILLMVATSFLPPRLVRRVAMVVYVVFMTLVLVAALYGAEVKGARRWLSFAGITIQPSEFVKPAFVVLAAWLFSEGAKRNGMPGTFLAFLLLPITIVPLVMQPDFGQTLLIAAVWCGLFYIAGLHFLWVIGLSGVGGLGILLAYYFLPHVTARLNRFFDKDHAGTAGDTFQVDTALDAYAAGGWIGRGPGEGSVKRILPDSHTDFIFSVTGEEFGIVGCLLLVALFGGIVIRAIYRGYHSDDPFCRFAAAGLGMLFGIQAAINMAVNLNLIPPKGMTLPFVSYGGSSLLSLALGMGFLLAVTRRRPRTETAAQGLLPSPAMPATALAR